MEPLENFANVRGAQTAASVLKQTEIAKRIVEYAEPAIILRQLCFDYEIPYLSTTIPKDPGATQLAIEVPEGAVAPIVRTKMDTIPVVLHKNQTHMFMTDEAEIQDFNGDLYTRETKNAGMRMARKTDYDIGNLIATATDSQAAQTSGKLTTWDISSAKSRLEAKGFTATHLVIHPEQWADIEGEATLISGVQYTSEQAKIEGMPRERVMGLDVVKSPRLVAATAYVMDKGADAMWYVYHGTQKTVPYVKEGVGRGALVTNYEEVVMTRADAITKITGC